MTPGYDASQPEQSQGSKSSQPCLTPALHVHRLKPLMTAIL